MDNKHKIFKVEVTFDICVLARNQKEAEEIAASNAADELSNGFASYFAHEVKDISDVESEWQESIPYSERGVNKEEKPVKFFLGEE